MDSSKEYTVNMKDCAKYIKSKWKSIALVTAIFAVLACGVAAFHYLRQGKDVNKLQKQLEEDYAINSENYEVDYVRATNTLENMKKRVTDQETYIYDSIYLNLDERNVLTTSVDMYLVMDAGDSTRKSYISLCADGIMTKTDWKKISETYGIAQNYLEELVKVEPDFDHGVICLRVLHPDEQISNEILDKIIGNMHNICKEYEFLGEAEYEFLNRVVKYDIDDELAQAKKEAQKLYAEYLSQLEEGQIQYDAFNAPVYPTFKKDFWKGALKKSIVLVALAVIAGFGLMCAIYYTRYIKNGIVFGANEYRRLTGIEMLGFFDGKDDNLTCRNIAIKIASQNKKNILLAGKQPAHLLEKYKTELKYQLETMNVNGIDFLTADVASDSNFIAKLYTAEAVVFVVERQKTSLKDCLTWQEMVSDAKKDLIGNIVI